MGEAGNFEIMPGMKNRLFEISRAMGISYTDLTKMALGSAELEEKMKKIKFPDAEQFASKETRQMIANLAEKGKDGEYRIKFTDETGKTVEKNISELSEKDVEKLKTPPKKMEELAVDQLSVLKSIESSIKAMSAGTAFAFAGTQTGEQILLAEREMYTRISDTFTKTFDVETIREGLDKGLQGMFDSIIGGNAMQGFEKAGKAMEDLLTGIYGKFKEEGTKNWSEFINSENKLIKVFTTLGEQAAKLGTEGLEALNEKLKKIVSGKEIEAKETAPGTEDKGKKVPEYTPDTQGKKPPVSTSDKNELEKNKEAPTSTKSSTDTKSIDPQIFETIKKSEKKAPTSVSIDTPNVKFFDPLQFSIDVLKNMRIREENEKYNDIGKIESNPVLNFTVEIKTDGKGRNDEQKLKDDLVNVIKDPKVYQAIKLQLEETSNNTIAEVKKLLASYKIKSA